MTCSRRAQWCAAALLLAVCLCGCLPGGDSQADDEREPHFLMGQKLARQLDYDGAVDAYEKALQVNPQSAAAHFELACLYENQEKDPAAAIYHYQRFLKLAPGSGNADIARDHINNCKLELAKTVTAIVPISASVQQNLEKLLQENRELKAQIVALQASIPPPPAPTITSNPVPPAPAIAPARPPAGHDNPMAPAPIDNHPPASSRSVTHIVTSGETLAAIARKYGVSLPALQTANPQVEPRRMRPGTTLNIPAP